MKFLVLFAMAAAICVTEGKRFDRCELVRELRLQGFPEDKMRDWVCLVEHESSRYTDKVNVNRNKSKDYGIFQINDKYWCSTSDTPGKDCNVTCADVMTDDITKACKCAKKIFKRHGFNAWYGWKNHCQTPSSMPDISSC